MTPDEIKYFRMFLRGCSFQYLNFILNGYIETNQTERIEITKEIIKEKENQNKMSKELKVQTFIYPIQRVSSSNLASVAYNPEREKLVVNFNNGDASYVYSNVPKSQYNAFMTASSHGKFYLANIKGYKPSEKLAQSYETISNSVMTRFGDKMYVEVVSEPTVLEMRQALVNDIDRNEVLTTVMKQIQKQGLGLSTDEQIATLYRETFR